MLGRCPSAVNIILVTQIWSGSRNLSGFPVLHIVNTSSLFRFHSPATAMNGSTSAQGVMEYIDSLTLMSKCLFWSTN